MPDKVTNIYKGGLGFFARLALIILAIVAVIGAAVFGFGYSFGKCFGQSCSDSADSAIVLFPAMVIFAIVVGWRAWHQHRKTAVLRPGKGTSLEDQVRDLLLKKGALNLAELVQQTHIPEERLLLVLGNLLRNQAISQSTANGVTTFSAKAKAR
jgi:hypothetical protein